MHTLALRQSGRARGTGRFQTAPGRTAALEPPCAHGLTAESGRPVFNAGDAAGRRLRREYWDASPSAVRRAFLSQEDPLPKTTLAGPAIRAGNESSSDRAGAIA